MIDKSWDFTFLDLAKEMSKRSKDPSTKVGAVIVRPNKTIASMGFNGFPQDMPDNNELYSNRDEKLSRIIHAEMNALIFAHESVYGHTLYTYPMIPCSRCFVHVAQAGIKRIVAPHVFGETLERWKDSMNETFRYAMECSVRIDLINYR